MTTAGRNKQWRNLPREGSNNPLLFKNVGAQKMVGRPEMRLVSIGADVPGDRGLATQQ
jgi:hypothetical protein